MPSDMATAAAAAARDNRALPQYPSVPEPSQDLPSIKEALMRLKEGYEMLTGQRGRAEYNLVEGLISIHKQLGNSTARMLELNEIRVSETSASAKRIEILEAEISDARGVEPDLAAKLTVMSEATVDAQDDASLALTRFGVSGTINGTTGGFTLTGILKNDGSAPAFSMEFDVNEFRIRDPVLNTAPTVFLYSGGKFGFTGDVFINGSLVVSGSIDTLQLADDAVENPKIAGNAVTNTATNTGTVAAGSELIAQITTRAGADLLVMVGITDTSATVTNDTAAPTTVVSFGFAIELDNVPTGNTLFSVKTVYSVVAGSNFRGLSPNSAQFRLSGLTAGLHDVSIVNSYSSQIGFYITVVELADR